MCRYTLAKWSIIVFMTTEQTEGTYLVRGVLNGKRFERRVKLMAPKLVAPYRMSGKRGKNDTADAAAPEWPGIRRSVA